MPKNNPVLPDDPMMQYVDPMLGTVLTLPEVMLMWGRSRRAVEMAFWLSKVSGRKTITGGTILLTRASVTRHWGQPKFDLTDQALTTGKFYADNNGGAE